MTSRPGALRTVSLTAVFLLATGFMLKVMGGVLSQLTIALFAMFLLDPAVRWATDRIDGILRRLPRRASKKARKNRGNSHVAEVMGSLIVILSALTLVAFFLLVIYGTGSMLMERKADLLTNVVNPVGASFSRIQQQWLPWLYRTLGMEEAIETLPTDGLSIPAPGKHDGDPLREVLERALGGFSLSSLVPTAANLLGGVLNLLFKLAIITILTVFLISGRRIYSAKLRESNPDRHRRFREVVQEVESLPRRYLLAKLLTSILTGLLIGAGLLFWMPPGDAFIWGFVAAVMNFIPFFGSLAAGVLITLYTLSVAGLGGLWAVVLLLVVNNLVSNVLEPNFFGEYLPIGKVTVLVCVLVWGFLWGITGIFLAVPITIMLKVFLEKVQGGKSTFTLALEV